MSEFTFEERRREQRVDEIIGSETCALLDRIDERDHADYQRGMKALALAPDVHIYRALMRGERVPLEKLDQEAVQRYGLAG